MCRPCSSIREPAVRFRPVAHFPPRRQPCVYKVIFPKRSRTFGDESQKAAATPAAPPPSIMTSCLLPGGAGTGVCPVSRWSLWHNHGHTYHIETPKTLDCDRRPIVASNLVSSLIEHHWYQ